MKETNVLFNNTLHTFYLWSFGVGPLILAARVLLYASSHRQDSTYHNLLYTSCGSLAGMSNSSMGPL